ncbi:uncharacterized protein LOC142575186 isoform X3 [Dermacentor variabilis]|uniref:uncharacterized protein LOC142575186 isoform X3 n=1 Tax=Dermacentor variabilis TaxID=34621 RepID=UPI003F5C647B
MVRRLTPLLCSHWHRRECVQGHMRLTIIYLIITDIQAAYDENVNDLKVDAMVKLLGCMRHTANYDVGYIIAKFMSNDAFLTRALCGAGYNIDSLLRLFFADDFMGELKTAERKCQKELL